ncbi:MAG: response regulator transcription factor [Chloroflexi bacterium]|nr:response regulator transcription factor [Chloroflexota bacterium]
MTSTSTVSNGSTVISGKSILIVEDDEHAAEISRLYLARDGHQVTVSHNGAEGLKLAQDLNPDLMVLDIMLPGMDGLEICRRLRAEDNRVPVIMLTARVDEADKLSGLDYGADDYMTKPFSPRELAARVRAVLRRTDDSSGSSAAAAEELDVLKFGDLSVTVGARIVKLGDTSIKLTPTEFNLLVHFMRAPGQVHPRERIIERVFGYDFEGFDRTLDTHVSNLRRKIEREADGQRFISTVYGVGYRFGDV